MEELELKDLWSKESKKARVYYTEIKEDLIAKAQKSSNDVIQKVKRNAKLELAVSILLIIGFEFAFFNHSNFVAFSLMMGITLIWVTWFYLKFLNNIKNVEKETVLDTLLARKNILKTYVKWMKWLTYGLSPIGFYFGFFMGASSFSNDYESFIVPAIAGLPLAIGFIWFSKKYIYRLYGQHLNSLNQIIEGLTEQ